MSATPASPAKVIKKEEKEAHLSDFIRSKIAQADDLTSTAKMCTVVAHSPNSPVAQAVAGMAQELTLAGFIIQTVFANAASAEEHTLPALQIFSTLGRCRLLNDQRLLDAHEQLVLGDDAAWVGDSMRRDPSKIDAYERYVEDDEQVVNWASSSFGQVWDHAKEVKARPVKLTTPTAEQGHMPPYDSPKDKLDFSKSSVGTRH